MRTVCFAANDEFSRVCPLPTFTGKGYVAFTGEITRLSLEKNSHVTANVHVRNVYRRDFQLGNVTVINAIERASSCDHQHKLEDVRLWVAKRHSSGFLTAVASLPVTMRMVDKVLRALPGMDKFKCAIFQHAISVKLHGGFRVLLCKLRAPEVTYALV